LEKIYWIANNTAIPFGKFGCSSLPEFLEKYCRKDFSIERGGQFVFALLKDGRSTHITPMVNIY
jgi:hypothetical protein